MLEIHTKGLEFRLVTNKPLQLSQSINNLMKEHTFLLIRKNL